MATYAPLWPSTSLSTFLSLFPRVGRPFTWLSSPKPQQVLCKRLSNSRALCIFRKDSERFGGLSIKGNCNKDGAGETEKTREKLKCTQSESVSSNETDDTKEKLRSAQLEQSKPRKMENAEEKSSIPPEPISSNKTEKTKEQLTVTVSKLSKSKKTKKEREKLTITLPEPAKSKKMEMTEEEKP